MSKRVLGRQGATGTTSADVVVPADEVWRVMSVASVYAASAVAGNRLLRVEAIVGGVVGQGVETSVPVIADDTTVVMFGPGLGESTVQKPAVDGTIFVPLPEFVMKPTDIVRVRAASGGDAGDVIDIAVNFEAEIPN